MNLDGSTVETTAAKTITTAPAAGEVTSVATTNFGNFYFRQISHTTGNETTNVIWGGTTYTYSNGEWNNPSITTSGGVVTVNLGSLTFHVTGTNLSLTNVELTGGISVSSGTLYVNNSLISGLNSSGITVSGSGSLVLCNTTVYGNMATNIITLQDTSKLILVDTTIADSGNISFSGRSNIQILNSIVLAPMNGTGSVTARYSAFSGLPGYGATNLYSLSAKALFGADYKLENNQLQLLSTSVASLNGSYAAYDPEAGELYYAVSRDADTNEWIWRYFGTGNTKADSVQTSLRLSTDQNFETRTVTRNVNGQYSTRFSMGAYAVPADVNYLVVNCAWDDDDNQNDFISLREAVEYARVNGGTVSFASTIFLDKNGTESKTNTIYVGGLSGASEYALEFGSLYKNQNIVIAGLTEGKGITIRAGTYTVDASGNEVVTDLQKTLFGVSYGTLLLESVTLQNSILQTLSGSATGATTAFAVVNNAAVAFKDVTFVANGKEHTEGGAISQCPYSLIEASNQATVTIDNSRFGQTGTLNANGKEQLSKIHYLVARDNLIKATGSTVTITDTNFTNVQVVGGNMFYVSGEGTASGALLLQNVKVSQSKANHIIMLDNVTGSSSDDTSTVAVRDSQFYANVLANAMIHQENSYGSMLIDRSLFALTEYYSGWSDVSLSVTEPSVIVSDGRQVVISNSTITQQRTNTQTSSGLIYFTGSDLYLINDTIAGNVFVPKQSAKWAALTIENENANVYVLNSIIAGNKHHGDAGTASDVYVVSCHSLNTYYSLLGAVHGPITNSVET